MGTESSRREIKGEETGRDSSASVSSGLFIDAAEMQKYFLFIEVLFGRSGAAAGRHMSPI